MRKALYILLVILGCGCSTYEQFDLTAYMSLQEGVVTSDSVYARYLRSRNVPHADSNAVSLLRSGKEKFDHLFRDIERAEHYIYMEYFNFRHDSIASALFAALMHKAREGLDVRIMFDDFGNKSNSSPLKERELDTIRASGVQVVRFDPVRFPFVNHIWHRDHRKIVVIDGAVAYTGGMNVADYYIHGLPRFGAWHDLHLRIEGGAVALLEDIFMKMWEYETGTKLSKHTELTQHSHAHQPTYIIDRNPKVEGSSKLLREAFVEMFMTAQDSVTVISPYFAPTTTVRKAMRKTLDKGVKVNIMVSPNGDIPITPDASLYVARQLQKRGANVYMFNGGFHHSKTITVDGTHSTVGSANLNSRSLRFDYEVNAVVFDTALALQIDSLFHADAKHAIRLTDEVWRSYSWWKRMKCWLANLLTPII